MKFGRFGCLNLTSEIWNRRRARPRCMGFRDRKETDVLQLMGRVARG